MGYMMNVDKERWNGLLPWPDNLDWVDVLQGLPPGVDPSMIM
jgi:hypothetical protein